MKCGSLSPDNRYLLLSLKSQLDSGWDLWLVDRRQGQARLLLLESGYAVEEQVSWCGKQAFCMVCWHAMHRPGQAACRADELADARGGALMRQLLWKEWRERRLWLLGWGASIIVFTAWGACSCFVGGVNSGNGWGLPWLMITAMFIGSGAYSSELAPGRAAFAYSRPVSWKAIC